jgi:glycosyltransferase involved in cell wall biosynthesis/ubiquinone/menaquinone biosynthesis C-methylase UbiE
MLAAHSARRNDPCPCGSGIRHKHCCGSLSRLDSSNHEASASSLMLSAIAHQRAGRLEQAQRLYRRALEIAPENPDALHMLGVAYYGSLRYAEASELIYRAAELTNWRMPAMRHNLGLVLAELPETTSAPYAMALRTRYREWLARRWALRRDASPLVTVVIPTYNHADFVEDALESVYGQTYRKIELIVIDDGSSDDTPSVIRRSLVNCPFLHRFVVRENRGAAATINEGIALASGEYVNVLNSDDMFTPNRIERMVAEVAGTDSDWGFGNVSFIDGSGDFFFIDSDPYISELEKRIKEIGNHETVGHSLLETNLSISTGNLFIAKRLHRALGGFRDFRYNHDWDFCLRALAHAEPVHVSDEVYRYRFHGANTISESHVSAKAEADQIFREFFATVGLPPTPYNEFAPCAPEWAPHALLIACRRGMGSLIEPQQLRYLMQAVSTGHEQIADSLRDGFDPHGTSAAATIVRLVGKNKVVLELGTGPGAITGALRGTSGCRVTGVEDNPENAAIAASHCEEMIVSSLDPSFWIKQVSNRRFDAIVAADVLEHLYDPWAALRQLVSLLAEDGYVVTSLPNVGHCGVLACLLLGRFPYGPKGLLDRTQMRFFTRTEIAELLAQADLFAETIVPIEAQPEHTEFAAYWKQVSPERREALSGAPDGLSYQYVIKAMRAARSFQV